MRHVLSDHSTSTMFHFFLLSVNLLIADADGQSTIANWQNAVTDLDGCVVKIQSLDQAFQSLSSRIQTIEKKFQDSLESLEKIVEEKFKVLLQTTFPTAESTVTPKIRPTNRLTTQTQGKLGNTPNSG